MLFIECGEHFLGALFPRLFWRPVVEVATYPVVARCIVPLNFPSRRGKEEKGMVRF